LRALVRELEEGAVAVAMASPQRRVPQLVWERIEKAVNENTRPRVMDFSFWFSWCETVGRWLRPAWSVG